MRAEVSVAQLSGLDMQDSGGPCHQYGGGAPQQQINTRARGQSSQVEITSKSTRIDVAKVCEESMCSRDVTSNVSQDDVRCDVLDDVKYEASPNAQPNRSMSVAELSQMRCANKMSSANISSEQSKNTSFTACSKNPEKPRMQAQNSIWGTDNFEV